MTHAGGERRSIEECRCEHVQCVEPAAGLTDVFDDEVARVVVLEPLAVLEGIVHLSEGHRSALEPAIEDLGDAPHDRPTGRVIRIGADEIIDCRTMKIVDLDTEVAFEFGDAAVDIDPGVSRVVALPHRDR